MLKRLFVFFAGFAYIVLQSISSLERSTPMKRLSAALVLALVCSLLLVSCGKTDKQRQMESDLNKRVMQMHDSGMVKMRQAQALETQLDSAKVLHDSLATKYPKDAANHGSDDIVQVKQKLASARDAMEAWMSKHKPYDAETKHDEAVTQLNAEIEELATVGSQLDAAIADATGTIENHRKFAAELLAKKPAKKGGR